MSLSSIALVVAYFGRFPNYFPLFLHTASLNPTIDWKIFSDAPFPADQLPPNVQIIPETLAGVAVRVERVLGFKPTIPAPYKLCDVKPLYGLAYADYLKTYDFWGHCDIDVLWGDMRAYLPEERFAQFNRVQMSGHLSLYRNTDESNNIFRLPAPGVDYRDVYTDPRNRVFDEWEGLHKIHEHNKIPYFNDQQMYADTCTDRSDLWTDRGGTGDATAQLMFWQRGKIVQYYALKDQLQRREYMYVHLQKRKMKMDGTLEQFQQAPRWYITGDRFIPAAEEPVTLADLKRLNPRRRFDSLGFHLRRPAARVRRFLREREMLRKYPRPAEFR